VKLLSKPANSPAKAKIHQQTGKFAGKLENFIGKHENLPVKQKNE